MLVSKIKEQEAMTQSMQMVLPSNSSIVARTKFHMSRNRKWPVHVAHLWRRNPQRPALRMTSQSPIGEKHKSSTEKHPKGSSDVQEPKLAGSSGLGGGDEMPQAPSQGIEAALSFLIAKIENLTGEMNDLKPQRTRSAHAQRYGDKSRSRDQASSQEARPYPSQKRTSIFSRAVLAEVMKVNLSLMRIRPQGQRAQVGKEWMGVEGVAKIRPVIPKVVLTLLKAVIFTVCCC